METITKDDGTGSDGLAKPETPDTDDVLSDITKDEHTDEEDPDSPKHYSDGKMKWTVLPTGLVDKVDIDEVENGKLKEEFNSVFSTVKEEFKINNPAFVNICALKYKNYMSENCYKMFKKISEE